MHNMKRSLVIASLLFTLSASAQALDAAARRQIIDTVAHLLETMYVIPETGKSLAAKIRAGSYDTATTAPALAEAMQRELASASDRHLSVRFNPAGMPPRDSPELRRVSYGMRGVQRLEGNVGYLDVGGFHAGEDVRAAVDAAMRLLDGSDAVIVDVRRCPGGAVDGVNYLASYFFGPERRVLMNRYDRPSNVTSESTTVDVAGKRMPDVDLYVLTSARSASACESFPYTLQQHGRAKIVGERTAGAGHNNAIIPLGHGLQLSISVGTATHPRSGKGWEAVGVQPDIEAPADRALDTARVRQSSAPARARRSIGRVIPSPEVDASEEKAATLLRDLPRLEEALVANMLADWFAAGVQPVTWEEAGTRVYLPGWREHATKHATVLGELTPLALPSVAQKLVDFSARLKLAEEDGEQTEAACTIVGSALAVRLHDLGWMCDAMPGKPIAFSRDGRTIEPFGVMRRLRAGELTSEAWEAQCRDAGIEAAALG
jgi:hypothetical protein